MDEIIFDEAKYSKPTYYKKNGLVNFLIEKGIFSDENQATKIILIFVIVLVIISLFIFFSSGNKYKQGSINDPDYVPAI
jgi:hypothetical protein